MSQHDLYLLAIALVVILAMVVAIARFRVHPFPALMLGSLALGLWAGASTDQVLKSFRLGFGGTLADVGIILALGAMFGELLASSGGAERVSNALLKAGGIRAVPWTMCAVSMILGLPLFFEAGVVLMMPIILNVGNRLASNPSGFKGNPYLLAGLPVFAGISVLHALVPPHPGPMIAISAMKADLGVTLILGLLMSVPIAVVAGPLYTYWIASRASAQPPVDLVGRLTHKDDQFRSPGLAATILTILFPILLMLGKAAGALALPAGSPARKLAEFIGDPLVALLLSVILAAFTFGFFIGKDTKAVGKVLGDALPPVSAIMLIIGAGGALKQTLIDVGLGAVIAHASQLVNLSPLLLAWFTAVILRLATGSATVAIVTASGLMAATVAANPGLSPALMALSIGSGSVFFSHINDAGFWLVKEYMGMNLPNMFKTWSVIETIIAVLGLALCLALQLVI
ncbi:MAG TPA: gluconate:H+ symporter [Rhizomicrobium sp.]|nr:gluconate:H+ symporter [Rhizomicrobium sp.]